MRYKMLSNWLGTHNGMCYYLMDTQQKPGYSGDYPQTTGHKLIKSSFNGKEIFDLCQDMNKMVDNV